MPASKLPSGEIGHRLRVSREAAGITQAGAARCIDVARTTIVAIEQGTRRIRTGEIQRLAKAYGTSVNAILRREAVFTGIVPRFRKMRVARDAPCRDAAKLLERLVRAEVELEALLGVERIATYPMERPLMRGDASSQAVEDATDLRQWLGIGLAPVRDFVSILELDLSIRVYFRPLHSIVSGLFAFDESVGACILINSSQSAGRRQYTMAHELGHFISARSKPSVMRSHGMPKSREERYADVFARAFLTPARTVCAKFSQVTTGASHLTRRHVIMLAHYFHVSREAMVRRLEELNLARAGAWDWFLRNGGITDKQHQAVIRGRSDQSAGADDSASSVTPRLHLLATEAWHQELLSEGQLAQLLDLDRVKLRELLDDAENDRHAGLQLPE